MVRRETANLLFVGSIPTSASIFFLTSSGYPLRLSLNNILSQIVPNVKYIIVLFVICLFLIYNCIKKTLNWSCQHIASLPFESLMFYSKFFRCILLYIYLFIFQLPFISRYIHTIILPIIISNTIPFLHDLHYTLHLRTMHPHGRVYRIL